MRKCRVGLVLAVFFISLLILGAFVQTTQNGLLTETRKSALIALLKERNFDPYEAALTLSILKELNATSAVDVQALLSQIVSSQSQKVGNMTLWNWPDSIYVYPNQTIYVNELYVPYSITKTLREFNATNLLDKGRLIDLVMKRYNASDGAFREVDPIQEEDELWYDSNFPGFHELPNDWIGRSNVISTFLAVSLLANLDSLNQINVTKTFDWILKCKADSGGFRLSPEATSYYGHFGFFTDGNGVSVASTYAAVLALKALGANLTDVTDISKMRDYVLSCQEQVTQHVQSYGGYTTREIVRFRPNKEKEYDTDFPSAYYAFVTLHELNSLANETELITKALIPVIDMQEVYSTNSWPIPERRSEYGLFFQEERKPTESLYAVQMLDISDSINLLNQQTPIVFKTWVNLLELSGAVFFIGLIAIAGVVVLYNAAQKRKTREVSEPLNKSLSENDTMQKITNKQGWLDMIEYRRCFGNGLYGMTGEKVSL